MWNAQLHDAYFSACRALVGLITGHRHRGGGRGAASSSRSSGSRRASGGIGSWLRSWWWMLVLMALAVWHLHKSGPAHHRDHNEGPGGGPGHGIVARGERLLELAEEEGRGLVQEARQEAYQLAEFAAEEGHQLAEEGRELVQEGREFFRHPGQSLLRPEDELLAEEAREAAGLGVAARSSSGEGGRVGPGGPPDQGEVMDGPEEKVDGEDVSENDAEQAVHDLEAGKGKEFSEEDGEEEPKGEEGEEEGEGGGSKAGSKATGEGGGEGEEEIEEAVEEEADDLAGLEGAAGEEAVDVVEGAADEDREKEAGEDPEVHKRGVDGRDVPDEKEGEDVESGEAGGEAGGASSPPPPQEPCARLARALGTRGRGLPAYLALDNTTIEYAWAYQNGQAEGVDYSHMAMVERVPGRAGKFLAVWQAATGMAGVKGQHVRGAFSSDLRTWTTTFKLKIPQSGAIWAPVLHLDPAAPQPAAGAPPAEGALWLFYAESATCLRTQPNFAEKVYAPGGNVKYVRSHDGRKWSEPVTIFAESSEGNIPKVIANKPAVTQAGAWVLPMWREDPGESPGLECKVGPDAKARAGVLISPDRGATWHVGGDIWSAKLKGTLLLEGKAVSLPGGAGLLQLFRSTAGWIYKSHSTDGGETWDDPKPTKLPNPNSKIDAVVMSNGMVALAYNHHIKLEDEWGGVRTELYVAVSASGTKTWSIVAKLEEVYIQKTKFHYPTLVELPRCRLGAVYTVGRKEHASAGGVRSAVVDLARYTPGIDRYEREVAEEEAREALEKDDIDNDDKYWRKVEKYM